MSFINQLEDPSVADRYFYAYAGVTSGLVLSNLGAAIGTAMTIGAITASTEADTNVAVPFVFAGVLGIYGIVLSVMSNGNITDQLTEAKSYKIFWAGLMNGFSNLAAGLAVGYIGYESVAA